MVVEWEDPYGLVNLPDGAQYNVPWSPSGGWDITKIPTRYHAGLAEKYVKTIQSPLYIVLT